MRIDSWFLRIGKWLLGAGLAGAALWGGTFGKVVAIGGHAADLALDEARGVVYVANFTANRIEVVSLSDGSLQTSTNVAPQPGSLALSPDGRYLVVAHFGNFTAPNSSNNALSVIDLTTRSKQTFVMGNPPLGVAFGIDNLALVVTTAEFLLLDPATGAPQILDTVAGIAAKTLPTAFATFPPNIVASSMATSADGLHIYGITAAAAADSQTLEFSYDVNVKRLNAIGVVSSPPMGPRVISVNRDGSRYVAGWALNDSTGTLLAQFPNPAGVLNIGSHAIDTARGLVYAQVTTGTATASQAPVLQILDSDNLTVIDRLQLPENLAGRSLLSSDGNTMYSASDSGLMILPVGTFAQARRVSASVEDLVFRGNFCDRRVATQQITIVDASGGRSDFTLTSSNSGVILTPSTGVTPATVTVQVDPNAFQNQKGTVTATIDIKSVNAVNLPQSIRVLVNSKEPDQRGTFVNVAGKLVDILPDPAKDRFFVLRQDKNQVLVFDGSTYQQIARLKTGNTPTQMAITFDRRYLLVGADNSQIINVFDLETLEATPFIRMPGGHYPRSIAASGKAILVANRVAGPIHVIDRVDMYSRTAATLPTLGIYKNDINLNTILVANPNGSAILGAQSDGTVFLYNGNVDTFTASRKDSTSLAGAYAASSFDQYLVGSTLLNSSLVPTKQLETGTGASSGFAFVDQFAFRTTTPNIASPGVIQRVNLTTGESVRPTRLAEAPVVADATSTLPFTRTLAPLYSRNVIINLTQSGFTVVPWNLDAAVAAPHIERVVNAADLTQPTAPGGLITVFGSELSPVNIASNERPLPTALGESCLTVNGIPVPMLFVSSRQINAQMPFQAEGNVTMILRTPGGISDNFNLTVLPSAPSVFRNGTAGPDSDIPTVIRERNNELVTLSNPIHRDDTIIIFVTGLGRTSPAVEAGLPAPQEPLASAIISPTVDIAGVQLPIVFAGLTPGEIGVYQINATVPRSVPAGFTQTLRISSGTYNTTVPVRVVD